MAIKSSIDTGAVLKGGAIGFVAGAVVGGAVAEFGFGEVLSTGEKVAVAGTSGLGGATIGAGIAHLIYSPSEEELAVSQNQEREQRLADKRFGAETTIAVLNHLEGSLGRIIDKAKAPPEPTAEEKFQLEQRKAQAQADQEYARVEAMFKMMQAQRNGHKQAPQAQTTGDVE